MLDRFRPVRPLRRNKSAKPPGYRHKRRETRRDLYDWITLWTAIIGVGLVCVGTAVTAYQAIVMREELRQSREQQRAWLRAEVFPVGPLTISDDGAEMSVAIQVTNVGMVPATGVMSRSKLIAFAPPGQPPVPRKQDEVVCPANMAGAGSSVGNSVFPGESVKLPMEIPTTDGQKFEQAARSAKVILMLLVCVGYDSGGAGNRSTEFVSVVIVGANDSGQLALNQFVAPNQIRIERIGAAEKAN